MTASDVRTNGAVCIGAALALAAAGCVAPPAMLISAGLSAAQSGASSFVDRELIAVTVHPLSAVFDAALFAAADLGFELRESRIEGHEAVVILGESDGTRTTIRLLRETPLVTSIKVRVGTWGDRELSSVILRITQRRLESLVPPVKQESG